MNKNKVFNNKTNQTKGMGGKVFSNIMINKLHNRKAKQRVTRKERLTNDICDKTNKRIREIFCNKAKERNANNNEEGQGPSDKAKEIK